MKFYSTNKKSPLVDFKTALFQGLAPDGGLYMPEVFPKFTSKELKSLPSLTLVEVGALVLQKWLGDEIPEKDIREISKNSLTFPIPVKQVGDYSLLELFHGQTAAFKDIAGRFLANLFTYYLKVEKENITILVATSGDTGGAIAQAFSNNDRVKVVILFPKGKVSNLQEEQLTRVGKNVLPLAIKGDFDDCQSYVKEAFLDRDLQHLNLSSANSINIGRLLPQIIHYVWCYANLQKNNLRFVVPSGNLGNITAGLFATRMGIPLSSFVIATNVNDSVVKYYKTGEFRKQKTISTLSNAMDIGNPNNFSRVLKLFNNDHEEFCKLIKAVKVTDEETIRVIKEVYKQYDYLLDFHTAVAYAAAEKLKDDTLHAVLVATASPAKFSSEIRQETGIIIDNKQALAKLQKLEKREFQVESNYQAVKEVLQNKLN